ncbi:MAG: mechanosensitive ion channel family protein [Flavobacteriales bacterium]|nr:mechanosensitive ion channel family protein [Flavobacteriales bacterium]
MENEKAFAAFIEEWLLSIGVEAEMTQIVKMVILVIAMLLIAGILWFIGQQFINRIVTRLAKRTKTNLDDHLVQKGFFNKLGHIIPVLTISALAPVVFTDYPDWIPYVQRIVSGLNIFFILRAINAFVNGAGRFLGESEKFKDKPVASFTQLAKIVIWLFGGLILAAVVLGKNPLLAFTALGAASAVLLFVFKDAILGFIASIQLTVNDMLRPGDWVSVPKYGADGDVLEIRKARGRRHAGALPKNRTHQTVYRKTKRRNRRVQCRQKSRHRRFHRQRPPHDQPRNFKKLHPRLPAQQPAH